MLWWGWIGFNCGSNFGITGDQWVVATRSAISSVDATAGGVFLAVLYFGLGVANSEKLLTRVPVYVSV